MTPQSKMERFRVWYILITLAAALVFAALRSTHGGPPSAPSPAVYKIPWVDTTGGLDMGVAISDGGTSAITFFRFATTSGTGVSGTVGIPGIGPIETGVVFKAPYHFKEHETIAFNVSELPKLADFKGSIVIESSGPLAGAAIHYGQGFNVVYPLQKVRD